ADGNCDRAKRQVRLGRPEVLQRAIFDAARRALVQPHHRIAPPPPTARTQTAFVPETPQALLPLPEQTLVSNHQLKGTVAGRARFRFMGMVGEGYLVLEGDEGL